MNVIWAIARNLILEVLRIRALIVLVILATAGYTVFLAWWLYGGAGQVDEKVQTFLGWSLRLTTFFLALLTIFISIATITRDIKRKEIFTIATKPVSRLHFLLGKFLGLALLNLMLVFLSGATIYALAVYYLPRTAEITPLERMRLKELVFTARQSVKPQLPEVSAEVEKKVEAIIAGRLRDEPDIYKNNPILVDKMRRALTYDKTRELTFLQSAVAPGGHIVWHFAGIEPIDRENGYVFIRYKQDVSPDPPDLCVFNDWAYGPQDPLLYGGEKLPRKKDVVRTVHEFPVPVTAVSGQGDLYVYYQNPTANRYVSVVFSSDASIEALYVAGGFGANFLRTTGLIYLRLIFLSALGLAAGAWLGFPVAVLSVLVIYFLGLTSGFVADTVKWEAGQVLGMFIKFVMTMFPSFSAWDPVPLIEKGRLVYLDLAGNISLAIGFLLDGEKVPSDVLEKLLLIKDIFVGGVVAFIGYLIFRWRELARVVV